MTHDEESSISNISSLSNDDIKRLRDSLDAAAKQLQDIDDIRESIKDLMKSLATELNLKPADLMTAAKVKYKNKRDENRAKANLIDTILEIAG